MKKLSTLLLATVLLATACRKIEVDGTNTTTTTVTDDYILKGRIDVDKTLKSGKTYKLRDIVYVVNGAKLTIEPGVTILGEKSTRGTLVITRGCQIIADATASQPIIFTSDATVPTRGDWGGIVLWKSQNQQLIQWRCRCRRSGRWCKQQRWLGFIWWSR